MKILKYKDGQGNWVSVPALIGPKGDKGDDGDKGDKGDRGDTVIIASKYSELTFPVAEGTYCLYNDVPYVANQAISTSEAWTAAHWDQVSFEDEIGELKNALQDMSTATAEDEGKTLKAKTVVNGKVTEWEFGEAGADPAVIEQAVDDWLDANPQATTTVQDGSLTEAKFTDATLSALKNDYVTPEMFGAKGDGETDDTEALQNMFLSQSSKYVFGNKTYLVDDSIDVNNPCTIVFNVTTIRAKQNLHQKRPFDYVLGIKKKVRTFGNVTINAKRSVDICLFLSGCGGSRFDIINCTEARIWGVCTNPAQSDQNSLHFNSLSASLCGFKFKATASRTSSSVLQLTNLSNSNVSSAWNYEMFESIFDNKYKNNRYVIDDSGYSSDYLKNRYVMSSSADDHFVVDENDFTQATFTVSGNAQSIPSDYTNKNVVILVGGGVYFGSSSSEGVFSIGSLTTQSNSLGFFTKFDYGGTIGKFASEYDTVMMATDITYALAIEYMYAEALGTGFDYKFNTQYDRIMLICSNISTRVTVSNPFIGTNRIPFETGNSVIIYQQLGQRLAQTNVLTCPNYMAMNKLVTLPMIGSDARVTITEYSPYENMIISRFFPSSGKTLIINILDKNEYTGMRFVEKKVYVFHRNIVNNNPFVIGLDDSLLSAGYTLHGSTNNLISIATADYGYMFVIKVLLFDKEFYCQIDRITPYEVAQS